MPRSLKEAIASGRPARPPACIITGRRDHRDAARRWLGRPQPGIRPGGRSGDRRAAQRGGFSAGTDGTDGPTDAAGALADGRTLARARALGLDAAAALERNDSYRFFDAVGDLIRTGPTGTNVMDVHLLLTR